MSDKIKVWCEKCYGSGMTCNATSIGDGVRGLHFAPPSKCKLCNAKGYIEVDPVELEVVKELRKEVDEYTVFLEQIVYVLDEQYPEDVVPIVSGMIEAFNESKTKGEL